jgi:PAS domain S-box-containing protein
MLDPKGIVTNWNAGAQRIKGYRPEEIIGQHFSRFYTEEDRANDEPRRALETAAREGRFEREAWRVRKDGTSFWANVVIDPIRNDRGELIGFAKVTRDLTERRATQRALEEAREQLFQAQKMEAVGQLTGGVAHDFNNLLMAVLGSLELLRKRLPDDPRLLRLLDNAVQGAQRGAVLTQRMLAFARRQQLKPEAVDLPALVHGMAELMQRSLGSAVRIDTRFPIGLKRVMADAHQLELAVLNLVVNARDAMPEGGRVRIGGHEEVVPDGGPLAPGHYVVLAVTDNGTGMDEATLARASEPFFTTKGPGKGTGLGLSLVHGVMEQLGGRLMLKSRPDVGTTAELWLPVAAPESASEPEAEKPADSHAGVRPMTILAVDDDSLVLMNTVEMLTDLGHTAFQAANGANALSILRREPIDLLVTDQVMPQMNGLQLVEAALAERPQLPVILATGFAELPSSLPGRIVRLGKPFRQDDLARAIAEAAAQSGAGRRQPPAS